MDELPFAVESPEQQLRRNSSTLQHSSAGSSLVTASSQGSFLNSAELSSSPLLLPDTPQDVVLPDSASTRRSSVGAGAVNSNSNNNNNTNVNNGPTIVSGPGMLLDEPEIIDFTYVNVSEDIAEEEDGGVLIGGNHWLDPTRRTERTGNVLAVLLSGAPQEENEALVVRKDTNTIRYFINFQNLLVLMSASYEFCCPF